MNKDKASPTAVTSTNLKPQYHYVGRRTDGFKIVHSWQEEAGSGYPSNQNTKRSRRSIKSKDPSLRDIANPNSHRSKKSPYPNSDSPDKILSASEKRKQRKKV